jgi:hypothetical protein
MRFGPWFPVDRHALQARDDKSGGFPFTLHPSLFTLATGYALAMTRVVCGLLYKYFMSSFSVTLFHSVLLASRK